MIAAAVADWNSFLQGAFFVLLVVGLIWLVSVRPPCWACDGRGRLRFERPWDRRPEDDEIPFDHLWCIWCEGTGREKAPRPA